MRSSWPVVVALAVGTACLVSGCSSAAPASTSTRTSTATAGIARTTAASSPSATASTTASGSPAPSAKDPDAPADQCADPALKITLREVGGGDEQRQTDIVFTNTGATACTLIGAPGVSVVGDGNGTRLGEPADRSGSATAVHLRQGGAAIAQITRTYLDASTTTFTGTAGRAVACDVQKGDGYRVYPPHSFTAVFIRRAGTYACTTGFVWMSVTPVRTAQ